MNLIQNFKNLILNFVNKPENGVSSSQTLYECLFYCINKATHDQKWITEASHISDLIINSQLPDGSFDIGYDFIFGNGLRKTHPKEGTSPEMLSISALCLYLHKFQAHISEERKLKLHNSIQLGINWIKKYIVSTPTGVAIPYAPLTFSGIHITNSTSFCISALATSLNFIPENQKDAIKSTLDLMYSFMESQLIEGDSGKYWPYFFSSQDPKEKSLTNEKIDNYHIAQQLYHHCLAQQFYPHELNIKIIREVYAYLISILDSEGFVPYTSLNGRPSDKVDLWGYACLIPAYLEAGSIVGDENSASRAMHIFHYIQKYCISPRRHFFPILLNSSKRPHDSNFYPRSDAWVIHSLSFMFGNQNVASIEKLSDELFFRIKHNNFSGLENHTLTTRKLVFSKLVNLARNIIK